MVWAKVALYLLHQVYHGLGFIVFLKFSCIAGHPICSQLHGNTYLSSGLVSHVSKQFYFFIYSIKKINKGSAVVLWRFAHGRQLINVQKERALRASLVHTASPLRKAVWMGKCSQRQCLLGQLKRRTSLLKWPLLIAIGFLLNQKASSQRGFYGRV